MTDYYGKVIYVERSLSAGEINALSSTYGQSVPLYRHYGVGIGSGRVIHFSGDILEGAKSARIKETSEEAFAYDSILVKRDQIQICYRISYIFSTEEVVSRARSKLYTDFGGYHFFNNNCEHFASWCACDKRSSSQVFFRNDDKDIVEKAIERAFEPGFKAIDKVENAIAGVSSFIRSFFK